MYINPCVSINICSKVKWTGQVGVVAVVVDVNVTELHNTENNGHNVFVRYMTSSVF